MFKFFGYIILYLLQTHIFYLSDAAKFLAVFGTKYVPFLESGSSPIASCLKSSPESGGSPIASCLKSSPESGSSPSACLKSSLYAFASILMIYAPALGYQDLSTIIISLLVLNPQSQISSKKMTLIFWVFF